MDGPLKPNQLLEAAGRVLTAPDIDNLAATADGMLYTSGSTVVGIPGGEVARFPSAISCLAVDGSGAMAIGLEDGGIEIRGGAHDGRRFDQRNGHKLNRPTAALFLGCDTARRLNRPTAALFLDADTLVVTNGSAQHRASQWRRDLMTLGRSGTVWRLDLAT